MRPLEVIATLKMMLKARQPVMLHGSPGIGKSDMVRTVARELVLELIDVRLSQLDPVDLRGVPSVDTKTKKTKWSAPDFLPTSGKGILFIDEINSAAQATQAAAYQLILDRRLGDYELPEGWQIVAAGNRTTDRAVVNQMSTALRNRFAHIDVEVGLDDWCKWALTNNIMSEVLAFIRFRPIYLNEFERRGDSKEEKDRHQRMKDANAFATPRSWYFLSRMLEANPDLPPAQEIFKGFIGEAAAAEFAGYLKYFTSLPNLDMLIMNPDKAKIPTEPASLYAIVTSLAAKATKDNFDRIMQYAKRLEKEFQVLLIKDAITRSSSLCTTKAFNAWAVENGSILA